MRYTENLNLKLPDDNDSYDQEHMNYNMEIVDKKINGLIPYWGTYETFPRPPLEDDINKIFIDISTNDPRLMYTWNTEENEYAPTGGSGKADGSSVDIPLTLPVAGWTGNAAPYSQTVTVPQMRESMTPLITLTDTDSLTDAQRYAYSLLTDYDTAYAQMTFYAADLPAVDIPVTLKGIPAQEMEFVDNTVVLIVEPSGFALSEDPEYDGRYVSTIPCEGMSAGAEGGSWDIVRSGPVLTLEESKIAASITDVKCLDGAVMIVCTEVPATRYFLKLTGTYADATPGDVILPNIQGYLDKVDELGAASAFSFDEVKIGTWVDGKPLYRKMIDFGELPNNGPREVSPSIPDLKTGHINIGESYWFKNTATVYTFVHPEIVNVIWTGTKIIITTNTDLSDHKSFVCLEYTKTTD